MPLFTVRTSKKVATSMKLEESTAKMLDRYADFHKGSADDVVNEALEYIFRHDKDFQQELQKNPNADVPSSVRIKKAPGSAKGVKSAAVDEKSDGCALRMKRMTLHPFQGGVFQGGRFL